MKNRSNIAASILQNPELLEKAYVASQNSEGVGDYQLSVYLDTIEAKFQEFKNTITEFSTISIDSEGIKGILDFLTQLMNLVNGFSKTVGGSNVLVGLLGGAFLQKSGLGFGSYNKKTQSWERGGLLTGFNRAARMSTRQALNDTFSNWIAKNGENTSLYDAIMKDNPDKTIAENLKAQGVSENVADTIKKMDEMQMKEMSLVEANKKLSNSFTIMGKAAEKGKNILAGFGSMLGSMLLSMGASFVISKGFELINSIIDNTINRRQTNIQRGAKAIEEAKNINKEYQNKEQQSDSLISKYSEYRKGVDFRNGRLINVSLSTDEYAEFIDVNKQLSELYPSLITGATSQGDAIIRLSDNAKKAKEELQEYLDISKQIAANETAQKLPDIISKVRSENELLNEEYSDLTDDAYKSSTDRTKYRDRRWYDLFEAIENGRDTGIIKFSGVSGYRSLSSNPTVAPFENILEGLGISIDDVYKQIAGFNFINGHDYVEGQYDLSALSEDEYNKVFEELIQSNKEEYTKYQQWKSNVDSVQQKIGQNWKTDLIPQLINSLPSNDDYNILSDSIQQGINTAFYNIDWEQFNDVDPEDFQTYVVSRFITPFSAAINNAAEAEKPKIQKQIEDFYNLSLPSNMSNRDYIDSLEGFLTSLGFDKTEMKELLVSTGYAYYDNPSTKSGYHYASTKQYNDLFELYGGTATYDKDKGKWTRTPSEDQTVLWDDISQLTVRDINTFWDMKDNEYFKNGLPKTFDSLKQQISDYLYKPLTEETGSFTDVIKTEEFEKETKTYISNLSSLTSAIDAFIESGEIADSTKLDLAKIFPDLEEFDTDDATFFKAMLDKRLEYAQEYMKQLYDLFDYENLSDKEKENAQNYFQTAISGLDLSGVNEQQAKALLEKTIQSRNKYGYQYQVGATQFQNIVNALGEDANWEIVANLALNPASATWTIEEWMAHYENETVKLGVELDKQQLEKMDSDIARMKARNDEKSARGDLLKDEDYQGIYDTQRDEAAILNRQVIGQRKALEMMQAANVDTNSQYYIKAQERLNELETQLSQKNTEMYQTREEQIQAGINVTNQAIERNKTDATKMEAEVEQNTKDGIRTTRETYKNLENTYTAIANGQEANAEYWETQADLTTEESRKIEYLGYANTARQEAADARDKAATYSSAYENDTITQLGYGLDELKAQAQEVNDIITLKQAKGLKVTEKEYKSLADITRKQVANLRSQNDEYKKILDTNKDLTAEQKRQYQSQIDANNSAITSALADIEGYNKTMDDLVVSNAKSLASAISSALSESLSGTGLETETINSLISGFSDLGDAADLSSVFYGTADGVKVDLVALQRLAQQQNQIINQGFDEKMNAISQAIEQASQAGDTTGLKNAQDELAKLQRQQSQYFATYEEQMKQFNRMSQIEFADQTDNAGKNYESAAAYLKSAKDLYDKGLIGTDDFKARAAYFDPYGRTDADTFLENYNRKIKYYTDDHTGVKAFLDDMVSKSLATYDKENGGYKLDFSDFTSAAKQMQFSEEELTDMLNRTVDYGFSFQFVSSMEEATLKASDLQTQLANASIEYADLIAQGADSNVLEDKAQEMRDIETEIANLDEATQNYTQTSQKDFIEGFQNLPQTIDALKDAYKRQEELGNESEMKKILASAQAYADKYGIKLNIKDFTIDQASYEAAMTNFIGGTKFGDVDLLNRKRISPEAMREFYPEFEGDYATLYSRAYSSEDGKTAVVVTPILPNGDVLEENALAEYAGAIAEGTEPPEQYAGITMATFKGEDAIEMANRYAEVAHSHEMFVDQNNAAMQKYLNTLKEFDNADLQAIEFGDGQTQIEGAEQALDGMLQQLGLGQEYGEALLQVLSQMGLIDYTPEIELGPAIQEVDALNDKVKQGTSLLKKMQANGRVDISFNMDQDPTQITDLSTLTQRRDELVKAQVGFSVDQSQYTALQSMIDKYNTQVVIQTILQGSEDAKSKLEELQTLATSNPDAFKAEVNAVLGPDTEVTEEQLQAIEDTVLAMSSADYPITVKIADEQMQSLTNQEGGETTMKILGDNSDAKQKAEEAEEYAKSKKPEMAILGDNTNAMAAANGAFNNINGRTATIKIEATGFNEIIQAVNLLVTQINHRTATIKVQEQKAGQAVGTFASGSVNIARTSGTAYNVLNYKPMSAYARGRNVALDEDQTSLVNEVGTEGLIRQGVFSLIPGGMHVMNLKKGDIILNSNQVKSLLSNGSANGRGKIIGGARALASGTVAYNGMSAFSRGASGGGDFGGGITNSSSSKKDNSSSDVSKDISNAASETKSALDSFKEWVEKFVDWIEVRLSRLQSKVDLYLAKSENAMGIGTRKVNGKKEMGKNDYINEAMRVIIGAINTTDPNKAKNGTLIGDNLRGVKRYQRQADTVRDKAINLGLVSKDEADKIIKRIQSGLIDINEYGENAREFINQYQTWYEKMMECSSAVEELRSQLKELQQTKLDNIVARFDALSGRSSAIQDSSKAIVDYYTASGRVVNSPDIKQQMNSQRVRQQEIVKYNKSAVERYEKELANAAKIFGEDSQEFHEAGQKLAEMKTAWVESETALKNLNLEIQKLKITKLQYVIDRVSGFGEKLSAIVNLRKTQGTLATGGIDGLNLSETDYSNQINNNNTLIEQYGKMIAWQQQLIDENHWDVDSEQYKAAYDEIQKCETALLGLYNTNLQLKESIRDMRWESFEKLQSNIANSTSDFEHLRSLISSAEIWDDKDQTIITKEGYANIALMGEEMRNYNQTIADNRVALEKLQKEYDNGNISLEKFEEESRKHINTIQSSVTAYEKLKDSIVDLYKTQLTNENKALQELIKKRQDALKAKKS